MQAIEAVEMAASEIASKKGSQRGSQRESQKGSQRTNQPRHTSQPKTGSIPTATESAASTSAPGATNSDKENDASKDGKDYPNDATDTTDTTDALPSTQPSKITPTVAATPEFLSIHVRTPRARFAWQELAGTPDTPKIRESLGMSPDAKLSWVTGKNQEPSPVAAGKQGTKRPRSSSPPSSPTNSRSKKVAENVQKFKEVMASATTANLALEGRFPRRRNALARHRTEIGRSTVRSDAADADSLGIEQPTNQPAQNGRSPRNAPGFRRSMSCNILTTPTSKRQKTDGNDLGAAPSPQKVTAQLQQRQPSAQRESRPPSRQQPAPPPPHEEVQPDEAEQVDQVDMIDAEPPAKPVAPATLERLSLVANSGPAPRNDPSIPDTGSNGLRQAEHRTEHDIQPPKDDKPTETTAAERKTKDNMSDYGDDVFDSFDDLDDNLFDDDMLAEIDASLAPPKSDAADTKTTDTKMADTGAHDEFGDLYDGLDDEVFTAVAAIETNNNYNNNNNNNPIDLTSSIPRAVDTVNTNAYTKPASTAAPRPAVGDMEDMFGGDDFGEDFDFDAAELAATQAANRGAPASAAAAPWANTQSV